MDGRWKAEQSTHKFPILSVIAVRMPTKARDSSKGIVTSGDGSEGRFRAGAAGATCGGPCSGPPPFAPRCWGPTAASAIAIALQVPVYWGAPDIADFVPESMIINANNYTPETAHLLARQLRRLETDDAYFLSFFRYPQNFSLPERYVAACKREGSFQCAMFRHLWEQRLLPAKRSRLCVPEGKGR